ncbi:hypothetical protein EKD04_020565 [Chloroflexales bacterium ZM16-3]|nr:hypothetical protein [Chloroflexales bacterium ZM16-3]
MRYTLLRTLLAIGVLLGLSLATPALAQGSDLAIDIQPAAGPPGTTVTIVGRGAPPGQMVRVRFAPFTDLAQCRAARDTQLVAEVPAASDGTFTATHLSSRLSADQQGNTYVADLGGQATSDLECFQFTGAGQPGQGLGQYFTETGHSVGGRFLAYWQQNGGLYVFGYPLSDEMQVGGRTTQYFERARFELWPENQPPYDVQLGLLGAEALSSRGINWQEQPASAGPVAGCVYFAETRHNVCNQQIGLGFLNTWASNGLSFDGRQGVSYQESLALFGMPITEPYTYTFADGSTAQVQWFERARLEWHPENPAPYRVLLGRLGAEVYQP